MGNTCPKCKTNNPDDSKFCKECATPLPVIDGAAFTKTLETPMEELDTGSIFAGRYQVIEELGRGGMGRVYKVLDKETHEKIALKLIKPEIASDKKTIERFRNELITARKIVQKNVCRMYDLNKANDSYYITMEYVSGGDLKKLIRRAKRLDTGTAISIARQICDGLEEAHSQGIVHRDLKPNNIMIDQEGNARIMDFGIARSIEGKGMTGAGVMIGTPEYMSPEQVEGKEIDQRSDIYSLGIILYEMVTGRVPFEGDTPFSIGIKHKSEMPINPKELNTLISDDLSSVILRCLEKEKDRRYKSVGEVRSELENIEKGIPAAERIVSEKKPLTSREITVQFSLRKLLVPSLVFAAIVVAVVIVILQPWSQKVSVSAPKIENSIAVISFKNQTGKPEYDYLQEVIPNLLITNLENTGFFYVATWERMQDILKQMGVKQARVIDSNLGFELCQREGIEAIALGTFSKAGDVFILDVKVLDTETKRTLKSTSTKGSGADSIFDSQIDELSRDISLGLGAGLDKVEATQLNIKGITTHSLEAYKYFLKGKDACNMADWIKARENLESALEIDPSFAMAYVYLSWTYFEQGPEEALVETVEKGMALSDRISQKDRLYLEALYAYFVKRDTAKAVMFLDELLQKYPDEKWALHVSGDFIRMNGDLEGAYARYKKWLELDQQDANAIWHFSLINVSMGNLETAEQYIEIHEVVAPREAANLGRQRTIYWSMGQVDKAIAKSKEILEVQPDLISSMLSIIILYSLKEDYEEALRWSNEYMSKASSLGEKWRSYCERGYINLMRGTYDDALADFTLAVQLADEENNFENKAWALEGKGVVYFVRGEFEASRKSFENMLEFLLEVDNATSPTNRAEWAFDMGMLALEQGQISQAKSSLSEIKSLLPKMSIEEESYYNLIWNLLQGEMLLAQGALDEALDAGNKACGPESPYWKKFEPYLFWFQASYIDLNARIYAKKGEVGQAISEYERLLKTNFSTGFCFPVDARFHYRLGLLYERADEAAKAKAQFEKFLDLWKDADPGIAEVENARERLANLMNL